MVLVTQVSVLYMLFTRFKLFKQRLCGSCLVIGRYSKCSTFTFTFYLYLLAAAIIRDIYKYYIFHGI